MSSPNSDKLLLLDTFYFLHRSFHAYPKDLVASTGEHTNIVFGFASSLLESILTLNPTHIACGWESEDQPSFRKELYPLYQFARVSMEPEDDHIFKEQLPLVIEVIEAFNIPRLTQNGFEGDDVLGTASAVASKDLDVVISTADQDLLQLINDKIFVYRPARPPYIKSELFDEEKFKEKYTFEPKLMIDYKALRGDPSDGIPGVMGIGDVTAKQLIGQFGTLENIYANIDSIKSESVKKKLIDDKDEAFMSKQLATIITNIPMEFNLKDCLVHDFDVSKVQKIFDRLGFRSLNRKLDMLEKKSIEIRGTAPKLL